MATEKDQDLQEFMDLRARITKLESALQECRDQGTKLFNRVGALEDALEVFAPAWIGWYGRLHPGAAYFEDIGQEDGLTDRLEEW